MSTKEKINYCGEDGYCMAEIHEEDNCTGFYPIKGTCMCSHKSHVDQCLLVKLLEERKG